MKTLEFFFDFASSYSYLAVSQVEALAKRHDAPIRWVPMALGGVFKATGNSPPVSIAAKASYMIADLVRWSAQYGIPFKFPPLFPVPSINAMRMVLVAAADAPEKMVPLIHACFTAAWVEGRNLGDAAVLEQIATSLGLPAAAMERIATPEIKEQLKQNGEEAVRRGAFGAPAIFVGEELYWGNDRLHFVDAALAASR